MSEFPTWELTDKRPCSISGVELQGDNLMRFIYLDEAGISASESITVVAGAIVDADRQQDLVETRIAELRAEYIPANVHLEYFHVTDIFSGRKPFQRPQYPLDRAIELLKALVSIPLEFGVSVALSAFQNSPLRSATPDARRQHEAASHAVAFSMCAMVAELYLR